MPLNIRTTLNIVKGGHKYFNLRDVIDGRSQLVLRKSQKVCLDFMTVTHIDFFISEFFSIFHLIVLNPPFSSCAHVHSVVTKSEFNLNFLTLFYYFLD